MLSYLRFGLLALVAIVLVIVALANRAMVTVSLLPDTLAGLVGADPQVTLPLFVLLGVALAAGLFLGLVWEWLRERGYRAEAARARREADGLRAELKRAERVAPETHKDDVLAVLEAR